MAVSIVDINLRNVRITLQKLQQQLLENPVPNFQAIIEVTAELQKLEGAATRLEAEELREVEREFNSYLREAKEQLRGWAAGQLEVGLEALDEGQRQSLEAVIDRFGSIFSDPALTTQLRVELKQQYQRLDIEKLWQETQTAVNELWRQAEYSGVSTQNSLDLFQAAIDKSTQAQNDAREREASREMLDKFKVLTSQSTARYDDFRRRNTIPRTLDQTFNFRDLISRLESMKAEDPDALVDYYRRADLDEQAVTEMMPVDKALEIAHRRWRARVNEQVQSYISSAEASLAQHHPETARDAFDKVKRLDITSPEALLDDDPPVQIADYLKVQLRATLQKIAAAEQSLKEFHATLDRANQVGNPEEAWSILIAAGEKYSDFVDHDTLWIETRPRVLSRYKRHLAEQVELAVGRLVAGDVESARTIARTVEKRAGADQNFDEVRSRAVELLQLCDDVQNTASQAKRAIEGRIPGEMLRAQSNLDLLKRRMAAAFERFAQEGTQDLANAGAALDIALNARSALAEMSSEAESSLEPDRLTAVLDRANAAVGTVPAEYADELAALQSFLRAKIALALGYSYKTNGQFASALTELRKAETHERTRDKAREILSEMQNIEEADEDVKKALADSPKMAPFDRVAYLKSKLNLPTTLISQLRFALREAEEQCSAALWTELSALKLGDNFDVQDVIEKQELLAQTNPELARRLNTRLAAIIADREARIHWESNQWLMASEKWQLAESHDQSQPILHHRRLAALKQAILTEARLGYISISEQVHQLEQRLYNDLPSDPDLLLALAELMRRQALDRTEELYELPTDEADERSKTQVTNVLMDAKKMVRRALIRLNNWMSGQDEYERVRVQMLTGSAITTDMIEARLTHTQNIQQIVDVDNELIMGKYSILDQLRSGTLDGFLQASKSKDETVRRVQEQNT